MFIIVKCTDLDIMTDHNNESGKNNDGGNAALLLMVMKMEMMMAAWSQVEQGFSQQSRVVVEVEGSMTTNEDANEDENVD